MSDDRPATYWFPAKRYGWGWGPPRTWQGWVVIAAYCGVLLAASAGDVGAWSLPIVIGATLALLLVGLTKGEPTSWRWGGK